MAQRPREFKTRRVIIVSTPTSSSRRKKQPSLNYITYISKKSIIFANIFNVMSKSTYANKLPRELAKDMALVGEQIRLARLRRNLSLEQVAERAQCSIPTLTKVEKGVATVSVGTYLRVLYVLGLHKDILSLAQEDLLGRALQDARLPHRERATKK
jgi:AraC-like DNA-binding protein